MKNQFETNPNYWDCNCEDRDYIHPKTEHYCVFCGAYSVDQPDSRQDEIDELFDIEVFFLYQSDIHRSKSSMVLFGVYTSFEKADYAAKKNNLQTEISEVMIVEYKLNKFGEVL